MKKKIKFLIVAAFLFIQNGTLYAQQDFTVTIPSTDNYGGYIMPQFGQI